MYFKKGNINNNLNKAKIILWTDIEFNKLNQSIINAPTLIADLLNDASKTDRLLHTNF